jgi:hypothetical protein
MHGRAAIFDDELCAASLARLEDLGSRGLGTLRVPKGREVSARELRDTPALSPLWLKRPLRDALAALLSPRYPLLRVEICEDDTL